MQSIGPYRLERELARGGMGVVYRAIAPGGEAVALKVILAGGDPELPVRFRREAEALARLNHPGILRVREHGLAQGKPYMVLDLLEGPTLEEQVKLHGPLSAARVRELGRHVAEALAYAHARGVVHRDLKPENVILRGERPVLVDFGLVRMLGLDQSRLTETGAILGTPSYMAPEQAEGLGDVGPGADVYGLGATLYFLATGRAPFEAGHGLFALLQDVLSLAPTPPCALRPGLDPALETVILRCLEKHPSQRYSSAIALERALGGADDAQVLPQGRRSPALALSLALGLAVLALGALGATVWLESARDPSDPVVAGPSAVDLDAQLERVRVSLEAGDLEQGLRGAEAALAVDPDAVPALLCRAEALTRLRRFPEAVAAADRLLRVDPEHPQGHHLRGTALLEERRFEEGLASLERALELEPGLAEAHATRGIVLFELGRPDEALRAAKEAAELATDSAQAAFVYGRILANAGRQKEALEALSRSIELDPTVGAAWLERGKLHVAGKRYGDAIHDLDRAVESNPTAPDVFSNRALAHAHLDDVTAALEDLGSAIALDPGNAQLHAVRGELQTRLRRLPEAIADFSRAVELSPTDPDLYAMRGIAKSHASLDVEALEDFDRALELNPNHSRALGERGQTLRKLGRQREALESLDRGSRFARGQDVDVFRRLISETLAELKQDAGDSADAQLDYADALLELKRAAEARDVATRVLRLDPAHARAYALRGWSNRMLLSYADAAADLDRALELQPKSAQWLRWRASARLGLGQSEGALADLTRSLELSPSVQAYLDRGNLRGQLAEHELALTDFRAAQALDPADPLPFLASAWALSRLKREAEALTACDQAIELGDPDGRALMMRGTLKAFLGRTAEAIRDLEQAAQLRSGDPEVFAKLGEARLAAGRVPEGISALDRALALEPQKSQALYLRAWARAKLGELDAALVDADLACELDPTYADAFYVRGSVLAGLRRNEEAILAFDRALELGVAPSREQDIRQRRADAVAELQR